MTGEIRFRCHSFHGQHSGITPKWHIAAHIGSEYGTHVAICGYTFRNILGQLVLSRAKRRPPVATLCRRCLSVEQEALND